MRRHHAMNAVAAAFLAWAPLASPSRNTRIRARRVPDHGRGAEEAHRRQGPQARRLAVVEPVSYRAATFPGPSTSWRPDYELRAGEPYPFDGMLLEGEAFQTSPAAWASTTTRRSSL